jgi:radical SAM-linked protein
MPKCLIVYEKGESVRWISHLDMLRTFERAIRRAELPIAFSAGFNPRERISFVSALSTGVTGSEELVILEMTTEVEPETVCTRLNNVLPNGIRVLHSQEVSDAEVKALPKELDRAEYRVLCGCEAASDLAPVARAIAELLAKDEIFITRERDGRVRKADIRPLLYNLALLPERESETRLSLSMTLGQGEGGTARPQEIVTLLQERIPNLTLRRTHRVRMRDTSGSPWRSLIPRCPA